MVEFELHWPQLLAAALLRQVLGLVWYSPRLFGPAWARLNHCTEAQMRARLVRVLPLELAASFVIAFVLETVLNLAGAIDWVMGLVVGLLMWLGFQAAATPNQVLYARRPVAVWLIDTGFSLLSFVAMSLLIATWRWDGLVQSALAAIP